MSRTDSRRAQGAGSWRLSGYVLLLNRAGEVLLLQRARSARRFPGRWDLPGGKVDDGEGMEAGILREVREETGLKARLVRFAGATSARIAGRKVVLMFFVARKLSGTLRLSDEHEAFQWVAPADLNQRRLAPTVGKFLAEVHG